MEIRPFSILAIASATLSVPASAKDLPTQMAATGKWAIDYGYTSCTATHDYGDEEGTASLSLVPSPAGDIVDFTVTRNRRGPTEVRQSRAKVKVGNAQSDVMMIRYATAKPVWRSYDIYRVPTKFFATLSGDAVISLRPSESEAYDFPAVGLGRVAAALSSCNEDLRKFWNFGGELDGRIVEPAKADVRFLFTGDDFPSEAFWSGQEGTGQFVLLVDEQGKFVGCSPTRSSGIPVFDLMSCGVIKERGKATPARGKDGKPVRSTLVTPEITFRLYG